MRIRNTIIILLKNIKSTNCDSIKNRELLNEFHRATWARSTVIDEAQKESFAFKKIKYAFDAHQISFLELLDFSQILHLKIVRGSLFGQDYLELSKDAGGSIDTACRYLNLSYQIFLLQTYYENLTGTGNSFVSICFLIIF